MMPNASPTRTETVTSPLDALGLFAHPDDAELLVGGTLALIARLGGRVGVVALTRGESATRGTPEGRASEAAEGARILGLAHLEILDLGDCDLANTQERRRAVVEAIRRLRPRLILVNALDERHPDHRRACELARDAVYLANVGGFAPELGARWRVEGVAWPAFIVRRPDPRPDWVVDVSRDWPAKMAAIRAYASQLAVGPRPGEGSAEATRSMTAGSMATEAGATEAADPTLTYIATPDFLEQVERRARSWGHLIGAEFAEPFLLDRPANAGHPLVALTAELRH
jgi:bacillithiol biosynthesis deacetylase BshB1